LKGLSLNNFSWRVLFRMLLILCIWQHSIVMSQTQSTQSAGPVRFLIFCSISIFLLDSLVAGRRLQWTAGADKQGMYSIIRIHWNIKTALASQGRSRAGPALYIHITPLGSQTPMFLLEFEPICGNNQANTSKTQEEMFYENEYRWKISRYHSFQKNVQQKLSWITRGITR
jgi:hypothetical protein